MAKRGVEAEGKKWQCWAGARAEQEEGKAKKGKEEEACPVDFQLELSYCHPIPSSDFIFSFLSLHNGLPTILGDVPASRLLLNSTESALCSILNFLLNYPPWFPSQSLPPSSPNISRLPPPIRHREETEPLER